MILQKLKDYLENKIANQEVIFPEHLLEEIQNWEDEEKEEE
jgi:hypothetical protein|tara:strand:+ start:11495 stop:11617 length:123 start_codon:yes stop_codon:yes gene_type:complete